jgi:hypothetical protein
LSVLDANSLLLQPAQVPAVNGRGKNMVISEAGDLFDPWEPHDPCQPPILWHLRPQHQKRRYPRCQRALVQHINPPGGSIRIQPPSAPCIRVQIVKTDWQAFGTRIPRVVLYLKVTDWAGGVVKNGGFRDVCHNRNLVLRSVKSIRHHAKSKVPRLRSIVTRITVETAPRLVLIGQV